MEEFFVKSDFERLQYNITLVPEGQDIIKWFPTLKKFSFKRRIPELDANKIIKYIILMYDRETPFREKYSKIDVRKVEVAKFVGFNFNKGTFDEMVIKMLSGRIQVINRAIVEYVRHHKNFKYSYLVGIEEGFYNILNQVIEGKTQNLSKLKEMQKELDETVNEMLNEDKSSELINTLLSYLEEERLELRPEDIAKKIRDGEFPITDPEIS
jgi:hypothetical protein